MFLNNNIRMFVIKTFIPALAYIELLNLVLKTYLASPNLSNLWCQVFDNLWAQRRSLQYYHTFQCWYVYEIDIDCWLALDCWLASKQLKLLGLMVSLMVFPHLCLKFS